MEKTTGIKYILLILSFVIICPQIQAISEKAKLACKLGLLGTLNGLGSIGAAGLTCLQAYAFSKMYNLNHSYGRTDTANDSAMAITASAALGNLGAGLFTGYTSIKAAQKAFGYFKQIKQELKKPDYKLLKSM